MAEAEAYEIIKEGEEEIMKIDAERWNFSPSLEDSALCMATTIEKLVEVPSVHRIIFSQRKNYCYDYEQTQMLVEIANLFKMLIKQKKVLGFSALAYKKECMKCVPGWHANLQYAILNLLKSDPLGSYVYLKRIFREEKIKAKKSSLECLECEQNYINLLGYLVSLLERTRLVKVIKNNLAGYVIGDRSLYSLLFKASIAPDFMSARLMASLPLDARQLDVYSFENSEISIYETKNDIKYLYHLMPPEFKLSDDKYALLDLARTVLSEHKPRTEEFLDPEKMRRTFFNIGRDLLQELADRRNVDLTFDELNELTRILVRYTIGFGLLELLLQDKKVQDITINGPIGQTPVFILHEDYDECVTNIIPSREDAESWATKFRILSGRPLDEANPILDTELIVPGARARVAIIQKPLNPFGLAYAFRRHRDKPWTLPLFIKNRMINSLGAGLMSFLISGARTLLVAGTRSSGKTSFLGSCLVEIMRKYRIITVEDSVTGDCKIKIKRNGRIEEILIGNLIDEMIGKYDHFIKDGREIVENKENIFAYSATSNTRVKLVKASKFIRHKINKDIFEVRTFSNKRIRVTGDHSLFIFSNYKLKEVKASDLKKNDLIVVADLKECTLNQERIKSVNLSSKNYEYVYDISVPKYENFVCGNILAHNTLELPTEALREMGYNIQPMKVRSALTKGGAEIEADEGIRTSLRLGDSSLIVGEIRSSESKALFEAMRIGALANVVAGTIHGDSAYGVFDRVVNDLGVPRTSFKAIDIIVICNPLKSPDGLHKWRRVVNITEVRKHWEDDPLREGGFVDLMRYNTETDQLEPTDDLINGDSEVLKNIAGNIKEWAGDWDAIWENILLRAKIKETLVKYADMIKDNNILEAKFNIESNDMFHRISEIVREEVGTLDSEKIFNLWEAWLKKELKKR